MRELRHRLEQALGALPGRDEKPQEGPHCVSNRLSRGDSVALRPRYDEAANGRGVVARRSNSASRDEIGHAVSVMRFSASCGEWPWTPRFQHLLVDQSQAKVGEVRGEALGRVAQLALMAAARRRVSQGRAALLMAAQYMGELARSGRIELFGAIVRYAEREET